MRIGEVSAATGVSARSLRYYEELGLLEAKRLPNGYRDYDAHSIETVERIRSLLTLGFTTELIEHILPCMTSAGPTGDCSELRRRVEAIRDDMSTRVEQLSAARDSLTRYVEQIG